MLFARPYPALLSSLLLLGTLPGGVFGADILQTNGFSNCAANADIKVDKMNIQYNKATNKVTFDVAGTSNKEQKVKASLIVSAYGKEVYRKDFNPCDKDGFVAQLCPVPSGQFSAQGEQDIPSSYASQIPAIAFSVPDLDGTARLELNAIDGGQSLACIQSVVDNGKTMSYPAVPYAAAGIAGAALLLSGMSSLMGAGAHGAGATPSPTFGEVIGWFQSMAMNGMLSVQYPSVYRSFTKNFAFSGGLFQWEAMQTTIDNFRKSTGGNLTENSVAYLKNATLLYQDSASNITKRGLEEFMLFARDISATAGNTTIGGGKNTENATDTDSKAMHVVHGIEAYVEQLTIPQANTFMTVLLIFAVIIAAITVGILLLKVVLETWALFGTFPKNLIGFRKRYWWLLAKTITNLILLLYGVWTLYCVYQFTNGDSWAAKTLAGVTLTIFTIVLVFFTIKIWLRARKFKKLEGDTSMLFEDKETWRKYSLFYENYKKGYWWLFVPSIIYMFAKGCIIAGGDGHGLAQTAGQLIIESLLLILLLWSRPYSLKSGNWINIIIQVVRVLSVVCILVFVEQLGIPQTTKTVTGVVLIVMQSVLTGLLAILIGVNSIIICCRENPHRKRRKEAEKLNRDLDTLTPLDARNSLLMEPKQYQETARAPLVSEHPFSHDNNRRSYHKVPEHDFSRENLMDDAASMGGRTLGGNQRDRSVSPVSMRAPTIPQVDLGYRGRGY